MAFSKMAGLEVTPSSPSRSTRPASSPEVMRPRRMLSYQMDWPYFWTSRSGFAIAGPCPVGGRLSWLGISAGRRIGHGGRAPRSQPGQLRRGVAEPLRLHAQPPHQRQVQAAKFTILGSAPRVVEDP